MPSGVYGSGKSKPDGRKTSSVRNGAASSNDPQVRHREEKAVKSVRERAEQIAELHNVKEERQILLGHQLYGLGEFNGDAYELLSIAYKSPLLGINMRIECAQVCIRYERPMLQAIMVAGDNGAGQFGHQLLGLLNGTGRDLPKRKRDIEGIAEDISASRLEVE